MDPKASAKSKRIHSTHGRRNHPTPSAAAAARKASPAAQPPRPPHPSALPSNWDRYDSSDDEAAAAARNPAGVAPKSKGADFGFLIEQARSQPPPGPETSLFPDFVTGFAQGASSILSVRGENLLSWCEDDNFIVDDDPATSFEVPFLSMDLHALAAQLSKIKLSQRLFIEADLLPEEVCDDQTQKTAVSEEQPETIKLRESSGSQSHESVKRVGDAPFQTSTAQAAKLVSTNDSKVQDLGLSRNTGTTSLDDALDTLLGEPITQRKKKEVSSPTLPSNYSLVYGSMNASSNPRNSAMAASFDDSIDLLLAETSSSFLGDKSHIAPPQNEPVVPPIAPANRSVAPKPVDDFDSWFDTL